MMSEHASVTAPTARQCSGIALLLVLVIAIPAAFTLSTVDSPNRMSRTSHDPTPYGYTVSLLLWVVPIVVIGFWMLPRAELKVEKKALFYSLLFLIPAGASADFFFAWVFWDYPNPGATLGILAPAIGGDVPIEEYFFWLTAFPAVLLAYIWFDEYWLSAYRSREVLTGGFLQFHPLALLFGISLLAAGVIYKNVIRGEPGFPAYFAWITAFLFIPSTFFFGSARPLINWRAFTDVLFFMALISFLWEATLAVPYGWWGYRDRHMLGLYIGAWSNLPIEEVLLWVAVTSVPVMTYHNIKRWLLTRAKDHDSAALTEG